ncbi:sensor histidine kinase [Halotia branconii]|uniref:histidine kinase n=1 Tax=Halotia branconii CENA392 TaxID=1539056 RepID=A0AAJ6NYH6_9CYAN|nr:HAMP domain-containing sensor histidine kinase [Halotia branconii]WGV29083.1 HAMP domain-containing sensor histidine kinase [Halotia branconii CENA392]
MNNTLDLSTFLHDISNAFGGTSLILNQLINGVYGNSLEDIKPLLIAILSTNNRITSLLEAQKRSSNSNCLWEINSVKQFDMLTFLQKLYKECYPIAQSRSLALHYEHVPTYRYGTQVLGDVSSIWRMLHNLLQNAFNYTQSGNVFLRILNQSDDLVIEIEDTGVGIDPEEISTIFLPSWRSPNSSSLHPSGSGLGLYIAMMVAKAHGLKLAVDSVVGKGTKFTIIFPYRNDRIYGLDGSMLHESGRLQNALPV